MATSLSLAVALTRTTEGGGEAVQVGDLARREEPRPERA